MGTTIASALAAAAIAAGGAIGELTGGEAPAQGQGAHTAVIVDASLARDGRDLVAPRLRALDAEIRIPRTTAEAETDLRYFAAQGYRLVVAGPDSQAAARVAGVPATTLRR